MKTNNLGLYLKLGEADKNGRENEVESGTRAYLDQMTRDMRINISAKAGCL